MTPRRRAHRPRTAEQIARTPLGPRSIPDLIPVRALRRPAVAEATLPNGLRVFAVRQTGAPTVEVRLRIPSAVAGRASVGVHAARMELLASTTLLGTASRFRNNVDNDLADVGGFVDTSVDPQRLLYSGSVLATGLPQLLEVLADVLTAAAYRRSDVLGERDRLTEHIALAVNQPSVQARTALQLKRFGAHPAALEIPDTDQVDAVGPAALRSLHRRVVVPNGAVLVLVGDLSPRSAVDKVAAALDGWTSDKSGTDMSPPPRVAGGPIKVVHRDGAVQSQVRLTAAATQRTEPDHAALQLANLVYAGYFSSRLVENIREDKGYTYTAGSSLEFWPGTAAMTVYFDTTSASTAAALLEARYEQGRLALQPPTAAEIASARNYATGTLAIALATHAGFASTLSALLGAGLDLDWLRGRPAALAAVTDEEVAAAAAAYLAPSAFTGIIVGDLEVIGADLQRLGGVELP